MSDRRPKQARLFNVLFSVLALAAIVLSDKGHVGGDGLVRYRALAALMEEGRLTPDRYSLVQPLLAVPLYVAGGLLSRGKPPAEREEAQRKAVARFNQIVVFATALWFFALARQVLGLRPAKAAGASLALLFTSLLLPNAKDFYSENLWTLCVAVAVAYVASPAEAPGGAALAFAALVLAVPLNPLLLPAFALVLLAARTLLATPRAPFLRCVAALASGAALAFLENAVRRGSPLDFGYAGFGFDTPFLTGLIDQLLSPARGVLFYMPAFLLGIVLVRKWRILAPARRLVFLSLVLSAGLLAGYSKWHGWHGGAYWGPRFLLPLSLCGTLYLVIALGMTRDRPLRTAALVMGALSYLTYKVGAAINVTPLLSCLAGATSETTCYWDLRFLPWASWISPSDLGQIAAHRSTAVEIGTLGLFALLVSALRPTLKERDRS